MVPTMVVVTLAWGLAARLLRLTLLQLKLEGAQLRGGVRGARGLLGFGLNGLLERFSIG